MITVLIEEANKYLDGEDFDRAIDSISKSLSLNNEDKGYVSSSASAVLLGSIPEERFVDDLIETSEIKEKKAMAVYAQAKELIFGPFKKKLAASLDVQENNGNSIRPPSQSPQSQQPMQNKNVSSTTNVNTSPIQNQPRPSPNNIPSSLSKQEILSEIEKPPRTVIKKYTVEYDHKSIQDPSHLIDDKVDEVKKLQDHYND